MTEYDENKSVESLSEEASQKEVTTPRPKRTYTPRLRPERLRTPAQQAASNKVATNVPVQEGQTNKVAQQQENLAAEDQLDEIDFDEELPEEILNPPPMPKAGFNSVVGDFLYSLGLTVELVLYRIFSHAKNVFVNIFSVLGYIIVRVCKKIFKAVKNLFVDTKEAFKHAFNAFKNLPKVAKSKKESRPEFDTQQTVTGYLVTGVKNHGHLLQRLWLVILPLVCVAGLVFMVTSMLSINYALDVTINDVPVGYVENETVLEDALSLLRMRVSLEKGQDITQWDVSPEVSIGHTDQILSKNELADRILENSSQDIQKGYGIYVDGFLVGATQNGQEIAEFLEEKKQPYYNTEEYPNAEVTFVRDIEVSQEEEVFLSNSLRAVEDLEEELEVNVSEEETHIVKEGDTLKSIAYEEKILYTELIARNPEMADKKESYQPPVGTSLIIQNAQPYLQVKTVYEYSAEEEIPYETVEEETDTRVVGEKKRTQKGEAGKQEVYYEVTIIDGEQVSSERLDDKTVVIEEATPEIYEIGTKAAMEFYTGDMPENIGGSGEFIWPVPSYSYSSRGYQESHGGLDINAPTGTAIYASSGGVVTFAGMGTGSYWSYGNFVQIQHPNGMVTRYAHCSSVAVSTGDSVSQGQFIASVGSTGLSSGPHCHFETVVGGSRTNPYNYVSAP